MITIDIKGDIARPEAGGILQMMGFEDTTCSVESIRNALAAAPDDPDVQINIDSYGGMVDEGLAIYDVLRTSGKNLHTNIIGACHSMAVCILLAAPLENRSANPNARALIHKVYAPGGANMTAESAMALAQLITQSEDAILDIYEARTGQPREVLEGLMDAEEVQDASALLKYGFISKINSYNTNRKTMATNRSASRWHDLLTRMQNALGVTPTFNYDYTDAEGKVLFSTEGGDDEVLKVGTVVRIPGGATSGEFTLGDGRRVKIEDSVVVEIEAADAENAARIEELESLLAESVSAMAELTNRNTYLEGENRRLSTENGTLRNQVQSQGVPRGRMASPGTPRTSPAMSAEELKNAVRAGRAAMSNPKK